MTKYNQPRALQWAIESSRKGRAVILIVPVASNIDVLKNIVLSAVPKERIRLVYPRYITFTSGGEIHFRYDEEIHLGREADFLTYEDGAWDVSTKPTLPLLSRFDLIELECAEM